MTDAPPQTMPANQAAALLGVKKRTLYTYVSRGLLRSLPGPGRTRLYETAGVLRLVRRSQDHTGHAGRARAAMLWGPPVLGTQVGGIDEEGPWYRGVRAVDLIDKPVEHVARLLWGDLPGEWPVGPMGVPLAANLLDLRRSVDRLASADAQRGVHSAQVEGARARRVVAALAEAITGRGQGPIATRVGGPDGVAAARAVLALLADHGLNASTFAARVVASTGADTYAAVCAALAALSGPRHGTASLALAGVLERLQHGSAQAVPQGQIPGFEHVLYPAGDPRGRLLLSLTDVDGPARPVHALVNRLAPLGLRPNVDAGLLAVCLQQGWPASRAPLLFALGRSIGWIAHIHEQRQQADLLRPTADYTPWGVGST